VSHVVDPACVRIDRLSHRAARTSRTVA
jgi:hypothetical protein